MGNLNHGKRKKESMTASDDSATSSAVRSDIRFYFFNHIVVRIILLIFLSYPHTHSDKPCKVLRAKISTLACAMCLLNDVMTDYAALRPLGCGFKQTSWSRFESSPSQLWGTDCNLSASTLLV